MNEIINRTDGELRRLGFADGVDDAHVGLASLNKAMSAANMDSEKRFTLKNAAYQLGLIDE
jgi:hypothetical protein